MSLIKQQLNSVLMNVSIIVKGLAVKNSLMDNKYDLDTDIYFKARTVIAKMMAERALLHTLVIMGNCVIDRDEWTSLQLTW